MLAPFARSDPGSAHDPGIGERIFTTPHRLRGIARSS